MPSESVRFEFSPTPIQQAKQTRGRRVYGGQRHYLPLRVNHGGVMPIIFAQSMLIFPGLIFGGLYNAFPNGLWGFWGVFFAIPLATLVQAVLKAWSQHRRKKTVETPIPNTSEGV